MRCLSSLLTIFVLSTSCLALDPESKAPYDLRVVLRIAEREQFTQHFRAQLRLEICESLQAALGTLGKVEIVEASPETTVPLEKLVYEKGLSVLATSNEAAGPKTHFVNIDFANGQYEIEARQHDGTSGFVTPIVRKVRTQFREMIARLTLLAIGRDFGIVGTFDPSAGNRVLVKLKGGQAGPVDRWVAKGEVFAVIAIRQASRRPAPRSSKGPSQTAIVATGTRLDGVLFRAIETPRDGSILCERLDISDEPFPLRGVIGYRCIKLGTVEAPLKLQLIDPSGKHQTSAALQVFARSDRFPDEPRDSDRTPAHDGLFTSKYTYSHVALVRVMLGNRKVARLPLEILDEEMQVRTIRLEEGAEQREQIVQLREAILDRLTDAGLTYVRCAQDMVELARSDKPKAIERGKQAILAMEAIFEETAESLERLEKRAKDFPSAKDLGKPCLEKMRVMQSRRDDLKAYLGRLDVASKEELDPGVQGKKKQVEGLAEEARQQEALADYDNALALYDRAIELLKDEPEKSKPIEEKRDQLRAAWALKPDDEAHAAARRTIYEIWPKLDKVKDIQEQLPVVQKAFEKCKAVGDKLTIRKIYISSDAVVQAFAEDVDRLKDGGEASRPALESALKVREQLEQFLEAVNQSLK